MFDALILSAYGTLLCAVFVGIFVSGCRLADRIASGEYDEDEGEE